jgi:hypothetical protein
MAMALNGDKEKAMNAETLVTAIHRLFNNNFKSFPEVAR